MAREGLTRDLTMAERRAMVKFNRGLKVTRAKNTARKFIKDNGLIIAVGTVALTLAYFAHQKRAGSLTP